MKVSKTSIGTAIKSSPELLKELFKGDLRMLNYHVKTGLIERLRFKFPKEKMISYFDRLPETNCIGNKHLEIKEKVAIMTFDDVFDEEIYEYEKSINAKSAFFLLSYKLDHIKKDVDLQLHYDARYSQIEKQLDKFEKLTGKKPIASRHHTLWWTHTHLEMIYLAMNGVKVDSSLPGIKPFRLCINGKLLPVWEVPFSVCDSPSVLSAPYGIPSKMETLFEKKISPIVGLFHPYLKQQSRWKDFYKFAKKHGYKFMTITEFYNKYLKGK